MDQHIVYCAQMSGGSDIAPGPFPLSPRHFSWLYNYLNVRKLLFRVMVCSGGSGVYIWGGGGQWGGYNCTGARTYVATVNHP